MPVSHGTDAVVTTKMVFAGSLRSVSGLGTSITSARFDDGPPRGHQCATGAPQLAYLNLIPSNKFSSGWLVRNGAPVLVAIDPRRGSESLRLRGAAVAVASSRTAAVARRIAAALLVLKLEFQNSCYVAVSCSVASTDCSQRCVMISSTLFVYWLLRAAVHRRASKSEKQTQLAGCKTLASKLGTRMQPFEYRSVR